MNNQNYDIRNCPIGPFEEGFHHQVVYIDIRKLMCCNNTITSLIDEVVSKTYHLIKTIELERKEDMINVSNIVTVKSSIWVTDKRTLFGNSPNIAIAYYLDHTSIFDAKPTTIDYPKLATDVHGLANNFPKIFDSIKAIKQKWSEGVEGSDFAKDLNCLTSLSRILMTSRNYKIDMYMFKNLKDSSNENNPRNLVNYSLIEGQQVVSQKTRPMQFHNEIMHSLKGCLSVIAWLKIEDSDKTDLLMMLLKSNVRSYLKSLDVCKSGEYIRHDLINVADCQVMSILYMEAERMRDKSQGQAYRYLCQLANGPEGFLRSSTAILDKPNLEVSGNLSSGNLTFSCEYGSATGIMLNGKLFLSISRPDKRIVESLETTFLKYLGDQVSETTPGNMHNSFIKLLPSVQSEQFKPNSNQVYYLNLTNKGEYHLTSPSETKSANRSRFIFVTHSSLVLAHKGYVSESTRVRLQWWKNKLVIGYEVDAMEVEIPPSLKRLEVLIRQYSSDDELRKLERNTRSRQKFEKIAEIPLMNVVPLSSYSFVHIILAHPKSLLGELDSERKHHLHRKIDDLERKRRDLTSSDDHLPKVEGDELNTVIYPILSRLTNITDIFSINLLLHHYGLNNVELRFQGIKNQIVGETGTWELMITDSTNLSSMNSTLRCLQYVANNLISKEAANCVLTCNISRMMIDPCKKLSTSIRELGVYGSNVEFLLYILTHWLVKNLSNKINERCAESMSIVHMLYLVPASFRTSEVDNVKFMITMMKDELQLLIQKTCENVIVGGEVLGMFAEFLKTHCSALSELIWAEKLILDRPKIDNVGTTTILQYAVPFREIVTNDRGYKVIRDIYKFICPKNPDLKKLDNILFDLCDCYFGVDFDFSLLPKDLMLKYRKRRIGKQQELKTDSDTQTSDFGQNLLSLLGQDMEVTSKSTKSEEDQLKYRLKTGQTDKGFMDITIADKSDDEDLYD